MNIVLFIISGALVFSCYFVFYKILSFLLKDDVITIKIRRNKSEELSLEEIAKELNSENKPYPYTPKEELDWSDDESTTVK